ncbi:MAG: endoglucanase [Deltaproteobacteria bacterium]|nr:endoglucanase [Deltaproteobacteria bacterium]
MPPPQRLGTGLAIALAAAAALSGCRTDNPVKSDSPGLVAEQTWKGYKHFFIAPEGRVLRPRDGDTVSEGQAYAMLRAAWMRDKETFDRCYRWTEQHLSRARKTGDHLLAWRWKDGSVADWMPASDADIDYALSLLLAETFWMGATPQDLAPYGGKADKTLQDILSFETRAGPSGRLYLLPWIVREGEASSGSLPQNPSYYSPAHFRIFFERSRDPRWLQLVDTGYHVLNEISDVFEGRQGVGLIPDWCSVDLNGRFVPLAGKSGNFGWEAVRVPFRIGLDWHWFKTPAAKKLLNGKFAAFIEAQWQANKAVYSEYAYAGASANPYENPAYYAGYAIALEVAGSPRAHDMVQKNRTWLQKSGDGWYYGESADYYVNSLAWIADGFHAGIISKK